MLNNTKTIFFSWVHRLPSDALRSLCLAAKPVEEGAVWEETILILGVSQLSQQSHGVLLGDLISQVGQDVLELSQHHGSVLVLVVELAELNVVVVVSGVLRGLEGLVDELGDLVEGGELLLLLLLAEAHADLLGDVETQGVNDIHQVVHVELAFAIPIVDLADLSNSSRVSHVEFLLVFLPLVSIT